MSPELAAGLIDKLLWTSLYLSLPILGVILLVGVAISVLQVATQIQEMTLSFVPKLVAAAVALIVLGPWMLRVVSEFATTVISNIPTYL